jgi:hypothetical protein
MYARKILNAVLLACFVLSAATLRAQDANAILAKVKAKLQLVKDYSADGVMSTDVRFINISDSKVKVYFRQPDQFKIVKEDGISILPKGGTSVGLNALLSGKEFTAVPGGYVQEAGKNLAVVKLLPLKENSEVVLITLHVDEAAALVYKTITTTKDNGTYETIMTYGKDAAWGLPSKVLFVFNISAYKLPKGVTMEYEGSKKADAAKPAGDGKGRVSISYSQYTVNKGLPANIFK